ncbi:hypothetical protein G7009_10520, partial [Pseudomonas capeferrum]|uniref:beta strand repeat-containing protein n=1 Tax=Pseudomonas capeferrum TaxID=1495066 RepID=UPI0021592495
DVADKVYDGSTAAELSNLGLVGVVDGDEGKVSGTGTTGAFSDKNAGADKSVIGSGIALAGEEAGNYRFDTDAQIGVADIDRKVITGIADVADKVYDGSTAAELSNLGLVGVVDGDEGKVSGTGTTGAFSDKNAGTDKSVTGAGIALAGEEAGNYRFDTDAQIGVADIDRKVITGIADVADKVYDGSTVADLSNLGLVGLVDGDEGKVSGTGTTGAFSDKNAGADKLVIGSGIALAGEEAGNYRFDTDAQIGVADIDRKVITGTADVADKVYDGGTAAELSNLGLVGVVDGDEGKVSGTGTTGTFSDKNAGADKSVIGSGIALAGEEAGNYRFDTDAQIGVADIDRKVITGIADVADKVYDGGTAADLSNLGLVGVVDGDEGKVSGTGITGAFSDKNAGTDKSVTGSGVALAGEEAGNYRFDTDAQIGVADIDRKVITGTADVANKVYDGSTVAELSNIGLAGVVDGDEGKVSGTGTTGAFNDKNAGTAKSVTGSGVALAGEEAGNYRFDTDAQIGVADIDRKVITGTADVADKVYDGGTAAELSSIGLVGIVDGDEGKVSGTGTTGAFSDKNAGTDKSVTGSGIALAGEEAGNYRFDTDAQIGLADIDRKVITGTADVADKIYDGSTVAELSNIGLAGVVDGDEGKISGTGTTGAFSDKNAGTDKSVSGSGIALAGEEAGNYRFDTDAQIGVADIDRKVITGTADVADKVYDGGTAAELSNLGLVGIVDGDEGKVSGTGTTGIFNDKNAGADKSVIGSGIALAGEEASNYRFDTDAQIGVADIDRKVITGTADVADKVYDGSTVADLSNLGLVGIVDGDEGKVSGTGTTGAFSDKNAGTDKSVSGSGIALAGEEAGNYRFDTDAQIGVADIDRKVITGTADVADKAYDGSTAAELSNIGLVGIVDGDEGEVSGTGTTGTFSDKNAGTDKSVTGSGIALAGEEAANYRFDTDAQIGLADIDRKVITGTADVADKVYDGSTAAELSNLGLVGIVDGDEGKVSGTGTTGAFSDKNAGTDKSVTGSGIALAGEEAGNYRFDTDAQIGVADIDRKVITGTADVADKVYDGSTAAELSNLGLVGVVDGDEGKVSGTGTTGAFNDKNAGTDKSVTGSGIALAGEEAGNYRFDTDAQIGVADIDRKVITGTADVADKVYDGSTAAELSNLGLVGIVDGDEGKVSGTGTTGAFSDKNAGTDKSVTGSGIALAGEEAGNYRFDTDAQIGVADIDRKVITGTADVADKVYDGSTAAELSNLGLVGIVDGDEGKVSGTGTTGAFNDKNVGTAKSVTGAGVALAGEEAGNYRFDTDAQIGVADIERKTLSGTVIVDSRPFDGTVLVPIQSILLEGVIGAEDVSASAKGVYLTPSAGGGKTVSLSEVVLSGADAGNYRVDPALLLGQGVIEPSQYTPVGLIVEPQGTNGTARIIDRTRTLTLDQPFVNSPVSSTALYTNATVPAAEPGQGAAVLLDTILSSNGRFSLALSEQPAQHALESTLGLYRVESGARPEGRGSYRATDLGNSITLEPAEAMTEAVPNLSGSNSGWASATVPDSNGGSLSVKVMLFSNGTLWVTVPVQGDANSDEEVASYGLAVAKMRLNATVPGIKTVVVERGEGHGATSAPAGYTVARR